MGGTRLRYIARRVGTHQPVPRLSLSPPLPSFKWGACVKEMGSDPTSSASGAPRADLVPASLQPKSLKKFEAAVLERKAFATDATPTRG